MLPIRDHNPSGIIPFMTYLLMAVNTLVFFYLLLLPPSLADQFVEHYALVPADIIAGRNYLTLLTAMFLHGSLGHLFGNMLFLNIFGDNLEAALGRLKYLLFYLICGLGASGLQILITPRSDIPNIGASGAIAGILGGYLILFPRSRVDVIFILGFIIREISIPAGFTVLYWFLLQLVIGVGSLGLSQMGGIAYFAHVGGFLTGFMIISFLKRKLQAANQPPSTYIT